MTCSPSPELDWIAALRAIVMPTIARLKLRSENAS
jgi:hypothetical protein